MRTCAVLAAWQNASTSVSWFRRFRYAFIPMFAVGTALERLGDPHFDALPAAWFVVAALAVELLEQRLLREHPIGATALLFQVFLTLGELATGAWLLRAGNHPGLDMLVQFVIPCAFALPAQRVWFASIALILVHNGLILLAPRGTPIEVFHPTLELTRQLQQVFVFDVSVLALTATVTRFRLLLIDREARLHAALEERARDDRLVSLGMMAAGIAHEMGTPLSSIDMLASEAMEDPAQAQAALATLRGQVQRCRQILDRVRGAAVRTVSPEVEAAGPSLRQWVLDWQQAGLGRNDLSFVVSPEAEAAAVAGDPDTWRGIVWSLLDNALRAGAPIRVVLRAEGSGSLELLIDDAGPGPSPETVQRAGQAFFSRWDDGGREGRGLALFVARSFARKLGGDLHLSRRSGGGGRVRVQLATIERETK